MKKISKQELKRESGITLIALIITIIILVILAAISIRAVTNMGIVGHAINGTGDYVRAGKEENKTLEETGNIIDDAITKVNRIQNGELTIGEAYDRGLIKIGDKISYPVEYKVIENEYSSNETEVTMTDWIVFGKDESGHVLLTTSTEVNGDKYDFGFNDQNGALKWLTCEEDIDDFCSKYAQNVQNKTVTARNMKLEDINRVLGFDDSDLDVTITFGTENEFLSNDAEIPNKVNLYYPSTLGAENVFNPNPESGEPSYPYMVKATTDSKEASGEGVIPAMEFSCKMYDYSEQYGRYYLGADYKFYTDSNYVVQHPENWRFVGDNYILSSKFFYANSGGASFCLAYVKHSSIVSDYDDYLYVSYDTSFGGKFYYGYDWR